MPFRPQWLPRDKEGRCGRDGVGASFAAPAAHHLSARQSEFYHPCLIIGQTVERDIILQSVWGDDSYANSHALNVQIIYLRKMFDADDSISIVSLKKRGYILEVNNG